MLAHGFGSFSPWLAGPVDFEPVVKILSGWKHVVEKACSPHGSQ